MTPLLRRLTVILLLLFSMSSVATAQNIESEVDAYADRVEQGRAQDLQLIAPRAFGIALERLQQARTMLNEGERIADIRETVQRGQRELSRALQLRQVGQVILGEAITARSDALEARAPEFATERWDEAEEAMTSAGREIENGDQNDARDDARTATRRYREAELIAIRADVLGTARDLRSQAREEDAEDFARQTWQDAESKLQEAEQILGGDRYNRSRSRELAQQASAQYRHALLITGIAKRIDDDVERRVEETLLNYESQINRVAEALGTDVAFDDGVEPVADRLVASVNSMEEDRNNLQESLDERRERIDRLQQVADSLDARLAELEQREQSMSAELQQQRERERTLQRVRNIFEQNEAEVLLRGDELIVRMQGLSFPVGSSEIRPENFSLLTKVQRVLREFPDGGVMISGHTDAQGNDATNQKLSEERAQAVREYLLANMNMPAERIEAVGYGESQPLATNETAAGRAKNRRIDVTINLAGDRQETAEDAGSMDS